jgi:ribulose bisphosphate carboxylase small subunit
VAPRSKYPNAITEGQGFVLGLEFLRARRAQNLSWMRMVEQSFRSMAEVQTTAGASGDALARLWTSQAAFVRDTASVYRSVTSHLAR